MIRIISQVKNTGSPMSVVSRVFSKHVSNSIESELSLHTAFMKFLFPAEERETVAKPETNGRNSMSSGRRRGSRWIST